MSGLIADARTLVDNARTAAQHRAAMAAASIHQCHSARREKPPSRACTSDPAFSARSASQPPSSQPPSSRRPSSRPPSARLTITPGLHPRSPELNGYDLTYSTYKSPELVQSAERPTRAAGSARAAANLRAREASRTQGADTQGRTLCTLSWSDIAKNEPF